MKLVCSCASCCSCSWWGWFGPPSILTVAVFPIKAIKGLHCYAVCPSSVKWHRSTWSVRALQIKETRFEFSSFSSICKNDAIQHWFTRTSPSVLSIKPRPLHHLHQHQALIGGSLSQQMANQLQSKKQDCGGRLKVFLSGSTVGTSSLTKADRPVESSWLQSTGIKIFWVLFPVWGSPGWPAWFSFLSCGHWEPVKHQGH